MKNKFKGLLALTLFFLSLMAQSQCYEVSGPVNDLCNSVENTYYAVGGGGTIRKSMDSGNTWEMLDSKVTGDFFSVWFVSEKIGMACGESGLLRTTDAGKTWTIVKTSNTPFFSIHFISENTGYAVSGQGELYKTEDSGVTWSGINFSETLNLLSESYFSQVFFVDNQNGFLCRTSKTGDGGAIYRTKNGGEDWEFLLQDARYVYFMSPKNGYCIKNSNTICKTTDGGDNWIELHIGIEDYITMVKFRDNVGYALGASGSILKTYDSGITWIFQKSGIDHGLNSIVFNSSGSALVVGSDATILKTENGGGRWSLISMGPPADANCIAGCFTGDRTAYILTSQSYLVKTLDAGVTWKRIKLPTENQLKDISFVNTDVGYVGSTKGKILKTIDGGNTWLELKVPVDIYKIYALNENEIFAFGYGCSKSKDGGQTWIKLGSLNDQVSGSGARTMHFLNDTLGFLLTEEGSMYITRDRGDTWTRGNQAICGICPGGSLITNFRDHIFVAGNYLYKSVDMGKSWIKVDYRKLEPGMYYSSPVDIYFTDDENGYLLQNYSDFSKTADGGINFTGEDFRGGNISLRGLAFSESYGLIFGDPGRIYRPYKMAGKYVGLPEIKDIKKRLVVYPNPSENILNVSYPDCNEGCLLEIYDSSGKIVYTYKMENTSQYQIDISFLPLGYYSLKAGQSYSRFIRN